MYKISAEIVTAGMSYALLAGLPAVYGLYGAFVPVLVYSVFGSSPHLAVGPVAVTSLLLGHALHSMFPEADQITDPNNPGPLVEVQNSYNAAAIQVQPNPHTHTLCLPCMPVLLTWLWKWAKL